jgi:hypothetical protein
MNDLEFRTRAYCNPSDDTADFVEASEACPERSRLILELRALDQRVGEILNTTQIPSGLVDRLKQLSTTDIPAALIAAGNPQSTRRITPSYMALAASVVVALGVTLSLLPGSRPSAQDLELHDHTLSHIYAEEPAFGSTSSVSWHQLSEIVEANGGFLREDDRTRALRIKFVKNCGLSPDERASHMVFEGSKGAVSVLLVRGSAVSSKFDVNDPRFVGRFMPLGAGTLIIVGEKGEPLESFESLVIENFEWNI